MPTYEDFETVAYSKQYNIIQLIKYVVEMSGQLDSIASQISDLSNTMQDLFELQGDMLDTMQTMGDTISQLAGIVAIHEERISKLEGS